MRIKNLEYRHLKDRSPEIILWYPNIYYGKEEEFIMSEDGHWYTYPNSTYCKVPKECFKSPENCITIAFFRKGSEDYYLEFVGDRPLDIEVNWQDFRTLIQVGYNKLNNQKENEEI